MMHRHAHTNVNEVSLHDQPGVMMLPCLAWGAREDSVTGPGLSLGYVILLRR